MRKIIIDEQELDMDELNRYILCDATTISDVFKGVEPFVDLTITSPPYYDALVYSNKDKQVGFKQTYEAYLNDIRKAFQGVYDISKDGASLYLNIDNLVRRRFSNSIGDNVNILNENDEYGNECFTNPLLIKLLRDKGILDIRLDISEILFEIGWDVRSIIVWDKCKTLPLAKKCTPGKIYRHEYIIYAVKGECGKFNKEYKRLPNGEYKGGYVHYASLPEFWQHNDVFLEDHTEDWLNNPENYDPYGEEPGKHIRFLIPAQNKYTFKHPCPFPPKLIAHLIKTSTTDGNEVVFDPFGGTGMVKAVANEMGEYKTLTLDISKESRELHYEQIIPYVKKKWLDIKEFFEEQERLLPDYTKSILELQITKFLTMLSCRLNLAEKIPGVIIYADDYGKTVPKEGEKIKVKLELGIEDMKDKFAIKEIIDGFYGYLSPGYFEFDIEFIDKMELVSKLSDESTDLAIYMSSHLSPIVVNPDVDDMFIDILDKISIFCSKNIVEKNKYTHLLPKKSWR